MTPERMAEIRPLAARYLRESANLHIQQHIGNVMAMEWERVVDQAAEVTRLTEENARLKAQVAAVEALADECSAKVAAAHAAGELNARDWLRDFERVLRAALDSEVTPCQYCDYDGHRCQGCGKSTDHEGRHVCDAIV